MSFGIGVTSWGKKPTVKKRRKQRKRGRGRRTPEGKRVRKTGWNAPVREKQSKHALQGFQFEVRLNHVEYDPWAILDFGREAIPYDDVVGYMRMASQCRVIGHRTLHPNPRRAPTNVRILLRTEQDLFLLRLVTNEVFRVYRLTPPAAHTAGSPVP